LDARPILQSYQHPQARLATVTSSEKSSYMMQQLSVCLLVNIISKDKNYKWMV